MGLNLGHVLGRNSRFYLATESTPGTYVTPLAAHAAKIINSDFDVKIAEEPRRDIMDGRGDYEMITGRMQVPWSIESYLVPSGTAGTAPDLGDAFLAAMGGSANSAGVSQTYSLTDVQNLSSLSLTRIANVTDRIAMESLPGCPVNTLKLTVTGGEPPKLSFAGQSMGHRFTGNGTLASLISSSSTATVQTDEGDGFEAGSVVEVDGDDNSGAGWPVASVSGDVLTVTGTIAAAAASGLVIPFAPTPVTAGSPISFTLGSVSMELPSTASQDLPITDFEIEINNNYTFIEDEFGTSVMTDAIVGYREITGKIGIRASSNMVAEISRRKLFNNRAITVRIGTIAGSRCTLTIPAARLEVNKLNMPLEEGTIDLAFRALDTAEAARDALTVVFT